MPDPPYRQVAEDLRNKIESGELAGGSRLAPEIELREQYNASRNTVRDAIKWLTTLGLVESRPGQGTFVVRKITPYVTTLTTDPTKGRAGEEVAKYEYNEVIEYNSEVKRQEREASYSDPQVEIQKATGEVAAELQITEGAQVISRHQKRFIDGTPWSLQTSYYPREFVVQGAEKLIFADDIKEGAVRYLAELLGVRQVGYRDWITVRAPELTEAVFFNLPQDGRVGVFEIFRTAFDQTGTPMRLTVTVYPTDRNQFIVNRGQVPETLPSKPAGTP